MSQGARLAMIRQAQLTWSNEDTDYQEFMKTGRLGDSEDEVLPFNPELRSEIVRQFQAS